MSLNVTNYLSHNLLQKHTILYNYILMHNILITKGKKPFFTLLKTLGIQKTTNVTTD